MTSKLEICQPGFTFVSLLLSSSSSINFTAAPPDGLAGRQSLLVAVAQYHHNLADPLSSTPLCLAGRRPIFKFQSNKSRDALSGQCHRNLATLLLKLFSGQTTRTTKNNNNNNNNNKETASHKYL